MQRAGSTKEAVSLPERNVKYHVGISYVPRYRNLHTSPKSIFLPLLLPWWLADIKCCSQAQVSRKGPTGIGELSSAGKVEENLSIGDCVAFKASVDLFLRMDARYKYK